MEQRLLGKNKHIIEILFVIVFVCFLVGFIGAEAYAEETYTDDDGTEWIYSVQSNYSSEYYGTICIRGCVNVPEDGVLKVPASINGTRVALISAGVDSPSDKSKVKKVILPDGIQCIWDTAFIACNNLQEINFPESLKTIGNNAFNGCGFTELELPGSISEIGSMAFTSNKNLRTVKIAGDINFKSSAGDTFSQCNNLREYQVTEEAVHFAVVDGVLYSDDMTQLLAYPPARTGTSFTVPDSIKVIGDYGFAYSKLTNISLPERLTEIGVHAFQNCQYLKAIDIPPGVSEIKEFCFYSCEGLEEITLHEGLQSISDYGFGGCREVKTLELPESLTKIGDNAFNVMLELKSIYVPDSVTEIGEDAFANINALTMYTTNETAIAYANEQNLSYKEASREEFEADIEMNNPDTPDNPDEPDTPEDPDTPDNPDTSALTPVNQTITAANKFTKYIGQSFALNAKAKTPLTYVSSNKSVATVTSAGKVTVKGYGTCKITINAAGTDSYNAAKKVITINGRLAKPTLKGKNYSKKKVKLTWSKVSGATGYLLYVKYPGQSKYKLAVKKSAKVKGVTHKKLAKGKTYCYKVRAYKRIGKKTVYSAYSKVIKVKVKK